MKANPIVLLLLGAAALVAVFMSSDSEAAPSGESTGPDPENGDPPSPDQPAEPSTGDSFPDGNLPDSSEEINMDPQRSPQYDAFITAYSVTPYHNDIATAEEANGIPENMLARLIYQESTFKPNATGDGGAALGLGQFHVDAATDMGITPEQRADPAYAIPAIAGYLKRQYDATGDWNAALLAYNQGLGAVRAKGVDGQPPSALAYASHILADSNLSHG